MTTLESALTRRASWDAQAAAMLAYARSCRNREKRSYAIAYTGYLLAPEQGRPNEPDTRSYALSYMGAQAVRQSLAAIVAATK